MKILIKTVRTEGRLQRRLFHYGYEGEWINSGARRWVRSVLNTE